MVYVLRLFKLMYCERLNTEKKTGKFGFGKMSLKICLLTQNDCVYAGVVDS